MLPDQGFGQDGGRADIRQQRRLLQRRPPMIGEQPIRGADRQLARLCSINDAALPAFNRGCALTTRRQQIDDGARGLDRLAGEFLRDHRDRQFRRLAEQIAVVDRRRAPAPDSASPKSMCVRLMSPKNGAFT